LLQSKSRLLKTTLISYFCTLLPIVVCAETFPDVGTTFTYDVVVSEQDDAGNETVINTYVEVVTILDVEQQIVTFMACGAFPGECELGQTDLISSGVFDYFDVGDAPPTRLIADARAMFFEEPPYAPGQFYPLKNDKIIQWARDGTVEGSFTQECCVADRENTWILNFEEVSNGISPSVIQRYFNEALGWHIYERSYFHYVTLPDLITEKRLLSSGQE